jgi:hypothetical protein
MQPTQRTIFFESRFALPRIFRRVIFTRMQSITRALYVHVKRVTLLVLTPLQKKRTPTEVVHGEKLPNDPLLDRLQQQPNPLN